MSSQEPQPRRLAHYLGLTSTRPKPSLRQALAACLWTLPVVVVAAAVATAVERADGPSWVSAAVMVVPIWVVLGLLSRRDGNRR